MQYTSAQAAKLLRRLNEEFSSLKDNESQSKEFLASVGEDVESVRPEYDFLSTQKRMNEIERKIRLLKHTINVFNATTTVPELDMTIDQVLVLIPQLSARKSKLAGMKSKLPKQRDQSYNRMTNVIDYCYLNYDLKDVEAEYDRVEKLLATAQTALDLVNSTVTMDIDL